MSASVLAVAAIDTAPVPRVSCAGDRAAAVERATAILRREGVVVLDDAIDPRLLAQCRAEIERDYSADHLNGVGAFGLDVDARRFSVALRIAGALADPAVLADPALVEIGRSLLGDDLVMDSFGLLLSLPGAPDQRTHYDALLFPETTLDRLLPVTTIAVAVPLVTLDEMTGSTAFWRGSHRRPSVDGAPDFAPTVPVGSVLLWDYRIFHHGLANRSDAVRPVLFSALSRPWWHEAPATDTGGYAKLSVARSAHEAMPSSTRRLLRRAAIVD